MVVAVVALILLSFPAAGSLTVYPNTPDLADAMGSVIGNTPTHAPGFGLSSWQATGVKSNFYITPDQLFGRSVTVADVSSINYWTDQFNYSGSSNWSLYIYTAPTSSDNSSGWYKSRLVASPGAGASGWDEWTTTSLDFSDPSRNGGAYSSSVTWADITDAVVTWANSGASRDYGSETIEYFSLQTDSGAPTFTGLLDGLAITLTNEQTASVNFEAIPERRRSC